jgi:hypothetical protein
VYVTSKESPFLNVMTVPSGAAMHRRLSIQMSMNIEHSLPVTCSLPFDGVVAEIHIFS